MWIALHFYKHVRHYHVKAQLAQISLVLSQMLCICLSSPHILPHREVLYHFLFRTTRAEKQFDISYIHEFYRLMSLEKCAEIYENPYLLTSPVWLVNLVEQNRQHVHVRDSLYFSG